MRKKENRKAGKETDRRTDRHKKGDRGRQRQRGMADRQTVVTQIDSE